MKKAPIPEDDIERILKSYESASYGKKQHVLTRWGKIFGIRSMSLRNRIRKYKKEKMHKIYIDPQKLSSMINVVVFYRTMKIMPWFSKKKPTWKKVIQLAEEHDLIAKDSVRVKELTRFIRKYNLIPEHRVTRGVQRHKSNSMTSHGGFNE